MCKFVWFLVLSDNGVEENENGHDYFEFENTAPGNKQASTDILNNY